MEGKGNPKSALSEHGVSWSQSGHQSICFLFWALEILPNTSPPSPGFSFQAFPGSPALIPGTPETPDCSAANLGEPGFYRIINLGRIGGFQIHPRCSGTPGVVNTIHDILRM
jgi:hypothetical protein